MENALTVTLTLTKYFAGPASTKAGVLSVRKGWLCTMVPAKSATPRAAGYVMKRLVLAIFAKMAFTWTRTVLHASNASLAA